MSEIYHANGSSSRCDGLDRLTSFQRGSLNTARDSISSGTAVRTQMWGLDALGNWDTITTNGSPVNRTHDKQNELTAVGGTGLGYDGNGNMTSDGTNSFGYDAWNRLMITSTGQSYAYDALGRRVYECFDPEGQQGIIDPGGGEDDGPDGGEFGSMAEFTDLYYSDRWQVLEERVRGVIGASTLKAQQVWSERYVDAVVLRDLDTGTDGTLDQRLYVQQDANYNTTALLSTGGAVQERYVYDPYGVPTAKTAAWGTRTPAGLYQWKYLHQGGRRSAYTGLYHFRRREYNPGLGRWMQQDPLRYYDGSNLYQYLRSDPLALRDPFAAAADEDPEEEQENEDEMERERERLRDEQLEEQHRLNNDPGSLAASPGTAPPQTPIPPPTGVPTQEELQEAARKAVEELVREHPELLNPDAPIHALYPDGTPVYEGEQPGKIQGPAPEASGTAHTVLQWDPVTGRIYKAREYGPGNVPIKDVDLNLPTFPNGTPRPGHTVPEEHPWIPNDPCNPKAGYKRGPGRPLQ